MGGESTIQRWRMLPVRGAAGVGAGRGGAGGGGRAPCFRSPGPGAPHYTRGVSAAGGPVSAVVWCGRGDLSAALRPCCVCGRCVRRRRVAVR